MAWKSKEERNSYQRAYRLAGGVKPRVRYEPKSCGVCGGPVRRSNTRCGLQHTVSAARDAAGQSGGRSTVEFR